MKIIKYLPVLILLISYGCGNGNDKNEIEASGNIEVTEILVSSKVAGEVETILKKEGEIVELGDTVLTIDHENNDLQLQQALAGQQYAEAQLKLLKAGAREEDKKQAEEALKQAEVNLQLSEKDKERMTKLYDSNAITKKQYEDATAKYEITLAQYNSVKENYKKLNNLARPEEITQAESNLKRQTATVNLLRKNISDSYVTSPQKGYMVKKYVEEGETVSMMSSLFKISDLRTAKLIVYVSEEELGRIKLGQKADISVDAFEDKSFNGTITYISPEAEFTPKNIQTKDERTKLVFAVKIEIPNPNFELKAGMPADAVIHLK
jgi:HlyD family secretion protein